MTIRFFYCLLGVMSLLLIHCSEPKCKFKPAPIFSEKLPHVQQYKFEQEGQQSLESLYLDTQVLLEVYQNVCEQTFQEYKFTVMGDFSTYHDSLWLKEAARQFVFLSTLSPQQRPLKEWADIIEERRESTKIGEDREVQPGIFIKIDRIVSQDKGQLLITFAQKGE
jgi:hypothetical protein